MDTMAFIVGSDKFEKLMMSIILSRTGVAMDVETHMFFTFWGLNLLRKGKADKAKVQMPPGMRSLATWMMKRKMMKSGFKKPSEMLSELAQTGKVHFHACSTTLELFGLKKEDLIPEVEDIVGAATFLDIAADADKVLVLS
ncbi:MAG: DsrE/DsrF/DrsH-like family protein [Candidatus Freyarchaeum deiterrae]